MLRRNDVRNPLLLLLTFFWATTESVLINTGCSTADGKAPQRRVRTAEKITARPLEDLAVSRYLSRAKSIIKDPA
ncbi:hypothetical protein JOB18_021681 [Solea senegalensis]|uniref:Secreted protein n=1 Tax=Solea senegalensis TaxID=28829 RepID=A0AAV6QMW6_SOLSE|nr:hypothetical protein JOB18_021681 [Solea senegalensis]